MTADDLIRNAKLFIGKPYVWGGESDAEGGYDCSGFLYALLKKSGYNALRLTASGFSKLGENIPKNKMKSGDFLFFGNPVRHCAIYIGSGWMIESRGNSSNTKNKPGKGVCISEVSRRSDLTIVRRYWTESESVHYKENSEYVTRVDHLHVRFSPMGIIKEHNQLTSDGMKHAYSDGCLKSGTSVTCKEVQKRDGATWLRIPSGWVCAKTAKGEIYID